MKNKKKFIIIVVLAIILIFIGIFLMRDGVSLRGEQQVSTDEPVNIVLDFYESWQAADQATTTDPYADGLAEAPILGVELVQKLQDSQEQFETDVDPVLCQTRTPLVITARPSYVVEDEAQILVLSRDEGLDGQSVATLTKLNDGWYISDITCSEGEFGEEREFTFDNDGYILKNAELGGLYMIFAENGVFGSVAPLSFDSESLCTDLDGNQSVCDPDSFGEKTGAIVRGQMSETGVQVEQVEFVEGDLSFE